MWLIYYSKKRCNKMVKVRIMSPVHGDMVQDYTMDMAAEVIMEEKKEGRASFAKTDTGEIHELTTMEKLTEWLDDAGEAVVSLIPNIAGG